MSEGGELREGLRIGLQTANNHIDQFFTDALEYFEEKTPEPEKELRPVYPEPHERQQELIDTVLDSDINRVVMLAGRRSGKTTGFSELAAEALKQGKRVLYAAPRLVQSETFFLNCRHYFADDIADGTLIVNLTKKTIERPFASSTDPQISARTAFDADSLRGGNADIILLDEFSLFKETADEVVLPMVSDRVGGTIVYCGTPVRDKLNALRIKHDLAVSKLDKWKVIHFTSFDNPFIDHEAVQEMADELTIDGYTLEVMAEFVEDDEFALWSAEDIDATRVPVAPDLDKVIVCLDVAVKVDGTGTSGVTTCGVGSHDGHGYVLEAVESSSNVEDWVHEVARQYDEHDAQYVLIEGNQAGATLEFSINALYPHIVCKYVTARGSKTTRAAPVEILYSRKKNVHHVGRFQQLEYQMCHYHDGDKNSPDLMDSLVLNITELLLMPKKRAKATGRGIKLW